MIRRLLFATFLLAVSSLAAYQEKPLVIVIPSYNNAQWYEKNLASVFDQEYDNYRVIYIDDCSTDGTYELVRNYSIKRGQQHRVTLLRNGFRRGALANHYKAVHMCADYEIVLDLDGDDWFKHKHVMRRINDAYQSPDVWLTYGQYEMDPVDRPGRSIAMSKGIIKHNGYREYPWITSALRTYYAGLFKRIKLQDLVSDDGGFYPVSCDVAYMFPMLEMAAGKIAFIPDVIYVYNCHTQENDFKKRLQLQLRTENFIRAKQKYSALSRPPYEPKREHDHAVDVILVAEQGPDTLRASLDSLFSYARGIGLVCVLCPASEHKSYTPIKDDFPGVVFFSFDTNFGFKEILMRTFHFIGSDCCMVIRDTNALADFVDLQDCAQKVEDTAAHGLYLGLGKNRTANAQLERQQKVPSMTRLEDQLYAWTFKNGEFDWRKPYNFNGTIYRKADIINWLQEVSFNCLTQLEEVANNQQFNFDKVGLCFRTAKIA